MLQRIYAMDLRLLCLLLLAVPIVWAESCLWLRRNVQILMNCDWPDYGLVPHAGRVCGHSAAVCRIAGGRAGAGTVSGNADECGTFLPGGAGAFSAASAEVALLGACAADGFCGWCAQCGGGVHAVSLCIGNGGDGRCSLQCPGSVERGAFSAHRPMAQVVRQRQAEHAAHKIVKTKNGNGVHSIAVF